MSETTTLCTDLRDKASRLGVAVHVWHEDGLWWARLVPRTNKPRTRLGFPIAAKTAGDAAKGAIELEEDMRGISWTT